MIEKILKISKRNLLWIEIIAIIAGYVVSLYDSILGFLPMSIAVMVAYLQYNDGLNNSPYEKKFTIADWAGDGGFKITILPEQHKKTPPASIMVFTKNEDLDEYSECMIKKTVTPNGEVLILSNLRFDGKVIIK